jgi:hypothetical protein
MEGHAGAAPLNPSAVRSIPLIYSAFRPSLDLSAVKTSPRPAHLREARRRASFILQDR